MRTVVILLATLLIALASQSQVPGSTNRVQKTKDTTGNGAASGTAALLNDINAAFGDM